MKLYLRIIFFFFLIVLPVFADNEPNNSCTAAEIINVNTSVTGTLRKDTPNQDTDDYYYFVAPSNGTIQITTSGFVGDMDGYLYNSNCSSEYKRDEASDANINISYEVTAGTTYKLRLKAYSGNSNYSLSISLTKVFSGDNFKDFSKLYSENFRGDIRMIGNTILGEKQDNKTATQCPDNNTNNTFTTQYWDVDNISSTFNSSSSNLTIPTGATIKKAYLYWQGRSAANDYAKATSIKFKQPGATAYTTLTASNNNVYWTSYGSYYPYQASVDVTHLINGSGTYTAADITTYAGGNPDGLGAFGAWSLIVVYAKDTELLQNITIYDGYKTVAQNNSQNFTLSGFLTPSNGDVNSKFLIFTGEGDVNLKGDYVKMGGTRITRFNDNSTNASYFNTFNSSITENNAYVTTRNPSCQNNTGIDIHTYDVGTSGLNIIKNNQTSATLEIGTNSDVYYLSVFAFATELYEPRVCYYIDTIKQKDTNTTIFENKKFVGEVAADKEYTFDIWISNMKKNASDSFIETAKLVQVYMNMTNIDYSENSMLMQNLGQTSKSTLTDLTGDDLGEFESDLNRSTWRVGLSANNTQGGTLAPASAFTDDTKKAFITYKGKFDVTDTTESIDLVNFFKFKASFQTDSITIGNDNAQIIEQCVDLNTSAQVVQPSLGAFNVVNSNFASQTISDDSKHADNALYTQIANQSFTVKLLALNTDFITLKPYTGSVDLSLITAPNYLVTDSDTEKQAKCDVSSALVAAQSISFNNESSKSLSLSFPNAYQNVAFKVTYNDNGTTKYVCSRDSFAIRPATYTMTPNTTPLVGGRNYSLTINATTSGSLTPGYSQTITAGLLDKNASMDLNVPAGCALPAEHIAFPSPVTFTNGTATYTSFTYNNVGDINVTVSDNAWTAIDQDSTSTKGYDDCIVGSTSIIPINGKVGCLLQNVQTFFFTPKELKNTLNLENFNTGGFTYISNDGNMSANALLTTTAILDTNATATNYTAKCFAKNISYTLSLFNNPTSWLNGTPNAISRIRYFDDGATTKFENNNTVGSALFSSTEGNFTNGVASNLAMRFNLTRATDKPDLPFTVSKNDFNITSIQDTNGTTGFDFNRTTDVNATFYYGRAHAPDYRFANRDGNATIYYETYCKDCNATTRASMGITGNESVDAINWYQNNLHTNAAGTVAPVPQHASDFSNTTTTHVTPPTSVQRLTLNGGTAIPYVEKVNLNSSSWLIHYPSDYTVTFYSTGSWAGSGFVKQNQPNATDTNTTVGEHIHKTAPARTNKRMNW